MCFPPVERSVPQSHLWKSPRKNYTVSYIHTSGQKTQPSKAKALGKLRLNSWQIEREVTPSTRFHTVGLRGNEDETPDSRGRLPHRNWPRWHTQAPTLDLRGALTSWPCLPSAFPHSHSSPWPKQRADGSWPTPKGVAGIDQRLTSQTTRPDPKAMVQRFTQATSAPPAYPASLVGALN